MTIVDDIDILIVIHEIRSEGIAIGFLDEDAGRAVASMRIMDDRQRIIAVDESTVLVAGVRIRDVVDDLGMALLAELVDVLHLVRRDRQPGLDSIRVLLQRLGAVRREVEGAVEAIEALLLVVPETVRLDALRIAEAHVGIVRPESGPVMVRMEIDVLVLMLQKRLEDGHLMDLRIDHAVDVVERVLHVAGAERRLRAAVELDAEAVRHEDVVDRTLREARPIGVDHGRILHCTALIIIVDFVAAVVRDIDAAGLFTVHLRFFCLFLLQRTVGVRLNEGGILIERTRRRLVMCK